MSLSILEPVRANANTIRRESIVKSVNPCTTINHGPLPLRLMRMNVKSANATASRMRVSTTLSSAMDGVLIVATTRQVPNAMSAPQITIGMRLQASVSSVLVMPRALLLHSAWPVASAHVSQV